VYKILDSQAIAGAKVGAGTDDKGKRKRIIKASTGITTEEAVVEDNNNEKKSPKKHIPMPAKKDDKGPVKRTRKKIEEKEQHEPAIEQNEEIAEPITAENDNEESEMDGSPNNNNNEMAASEAPAQNKVY